MKAVKIVHKAIPCIARIVRRWFLLLVVLWVLLVLYPNPTKLVLSIKRVFNPEIDTAAVERLADQLPDNPADIEQEVIRLMPYKCDWELYNMPWYTPTAREILANGAGDCKARALILASVLDVKGIEYSIKLSITHMWVAYDDKPENTMENSDVQYFQKDPKTGQSSLQLPAISFPESVKNVKIVSSGFWSPMPLYKKLLLTIGLTTLFVLRFTLLRKKRASYKEPSIATMPREIESA